MILSSKRGYLKISIKFKMDLIKKSTSVLKSLQLKNGGILATPKNGAYPYVYIRDGVMMTKALNRVKHEKNSEKFYYFVNEHADLDQYSEIFHRYHKDGWPSVSRKHQHDNTGLILHGIYDTYLHTKNKEFLRDMWPLIKKCSGLVFKFSRNKNGLIRTETSIHELYELEKGHEIWANCACTRGLYDASEIAKILGYKNECKEWQKKAKQIHSNILKKMFNRKTGLFMKNLRFPEVCDSSQLSPFYFNLANSQQILKRTLKHLEKNLWYREAGGFRRFRKFEVTKDWHWYTGGSGGWTVFTAWTGKFYRKIGENKSCSRCERWIKKTAKRTEGILPEHIATREEYDVWKENEIEFNSRILKGMQKSEELNEKFVKKFKEDIVYWAVPLGWSHAEYILMKKDIGKNV